MPKGGTTGEGAGGPNLQLRRAGVDDYSTIRNVQSMAIRSLAGKILDDIEIVNAVRAVYSPEYIAELFRKTVHVAVLNGEIVGTCAWGPSDDRGTAARISGLFVKPLSQGSGIGARLIDAVTRDAAQNGFSRFMATVPVATAPLFSALGFITASYGTSRDVVPNTSLQVAFLRTP